MRPRLSLVLWLLGLAIAVSASVPIVEDGLEEHLKDVAHNEAGEVLKHDSVKGEKVHDVEKKIKDIHENQVSKATDDATFLSKEQDHKSASESDQYKGHNAHQDKAEDSATTGFKRGHKKGHHKQGFQNSYHKDESSNKSTFFDDLTDEGDQAQYNSRLNSHDNFGGRNYHGGHTAAQEYVKDNNRAGGYNKHSDYGLRNRQYQDYGRDHYLDDTANYNKHRNGYDTYDRNKLHNRREYHHPPPPPPPVHNEGWDWQRWENSRAGLPRGGWEREQGWRADPGWRAEPGWRRDAGWGRDYAGPGYYDDRGLRHDGGYGRGPYHGYGYGYGESRNTPVAEVPKDAPVVAHRQQTITIYEDPRYDGTQKGQLRRDEGDQVQLDFKPSSQRYAKYDDTYYASVPARTAQRAESSNINRLVYNYKRQ